MNWAALAQLAPLVPDIEAMLATFRRLENDPDVKHAIATAEKVGAILAAPAPKPNQPADH